MSRPKENPVRSELYRRTVANLPCANCGLWGYSQAAHPPATGRGRKENDLLCVPLCCTRPGILGCHVDNDQYRLGTHAETVERMAIWAKETQTKIKANGDWRAEWDSAECKYPYCLENEDERCPRWLTGECDGPPR